MKKLLIVATICAVVSAYAQQQDAGLAAAANAKEEETLPRFLLFFISAQNVPPLCSFRKDGLRAR